MGAIILWPYNHPPPRPCAAEPMNSQRFYEKSLPLSGERVNRNKKMKLLQNLGIPCILLLITACAPMQLKLQTIPIPPERIAQKGYSLVPPNEKGWVIGGRNPHQLALGKHGSNPDETFAIQTMLFRLPAFKTTQELALLVKDGQAKDTDLQRFKIIRHDVAVHPDKNADCVKSHTVTEDHGAVKRSGKAGVMILDALTLTCAHPKNKSVGVNVVYSQRHYPEQGDSGFIEKATTIFDSVEFTDL